MLLCKALTYACSSNGQVDNEIDHIEKELRRNTRYTEKRADNDLQIRFGLPVDIRSGDFDGDVVSSFRQENIGHRFPIAGSIENSKQVLITVDLDKLNFYEVSEELGLSVYMVVKLGDEVCEHQCINQIEVLHLNKMMSSLVVCLCDNHIIYLVSMKTGEILSSVDLKVRFDKFVLSGTDIFLYGDCCYITLMRIGPDSGHIHRSKILHLSFWAHGFIRVDSSQLLVVDEKGSCVQYMLSKNGEFNSAASSNLNGVKVGISSFGKICFIKQINSDSCLICQEFGWSVYKFVSSPPSFDEMISSPIPSTFEKVVTCRNALRFAILMSNCEVMYIDNGRVQLMDKETAVDIFNIGSKLCGFFTPDDVGDNSATTSLRFMCSNTSVKFNIFDVDHPGSHPFYDNIILEGVILSVLNKRELCILSVGGDILSRLGTFNHPLLLAINASPVLEKLRTKNLLCLLLLDEKGHLTIFILHDKTYFVKSRLTLATMEFITKVETPSDQSIFVITDVGGKKSVVDLELMAVKQKSSCSVSSNNLVVVYDAFNVFYSCSGPRLTLNNWISRRPWSFFEVKNISKGSEVSKLIKNTFVEGGWVSISLETPAQTIAYHIPPNFDDIFSAEFEILRSSFDTFRTRSLRKTNEQEIIKIQKDLCSVIRNYPCDISSKAFDALSNLIDQVARSLPQLSNKIFNYWKRKIMAITNVNIDFSFLDGIITLSKYIACGLMTLDKVYLNNVLELLGSSSSKDCCIALKILDLIFIPRIDKYGEECLKFVIALVNVRQFADQNGKPELTELCNICIDDFFTEYATLFSSIVCCLMASSNTSFITKQGTVEVLNYLLTDQTNRIDCTIIMLILEVLSSTELHKSLLLLDGNQRQSVLNLIDLTWNILVGGFSKQLQTIREPHRMFICSIFDKNIDSGYAGWFWEKSDDCSVHDVFYLEVPNKTQDYSDSVGQNYTNGPRFDIIGYDWYAVPKISTTLQKIAALNFDTLSIDIWNLRPNEIHLTDKIVNSRIMMNEMVPLKVPNMRLVLLQLLWSKGKYSEKFSRIPITKLIQLYQANKLEKGENLEEKTIKCDKHIFFGSVFHRYLDVFKDIKYSDLDIEWFDSGKDPRIGLKLRKKVIFMYQI